MLIFMNLKLQAILNYKTIAKKHYIIYIILIRWYKGKTILN